MASKHFTYQFDWGFMTIDSRKEDEPKGYIAKFPITDEEREVIDQNGASVKIKGKKLEITPPEENPMQPMYEAEQERKNGLQREYNEWLQTSCGKVASKYLRYVRNGNWDEEQVA